MAGLVIDLPTLIGLFIGAGLVLFLLLGMAYDHRNARSYAAERNRPLFHCGKCEHIYAGERGCESMACPRCGHMNLRLKF